MALNGFFRTAFWALAACGLVYAMFLGALIHPDIQRNVTYANKVNPTFFQDLNNTEQFGFIKHQVQAFTVTTPDNVTLYAWHILPLHLYSKHEKELKAQPDHGLQPYDTASQTVGLQLLLNNPEAIVVVSFHGNAAHLASNYRPASYQQHLGLSTPEKPVHVIAFDYRGFGLSTGSPTEEGVIQDSVSLLSALTGHPALVNESGSEIQKALNPSQIILVGQSMGTFISSAVYHEWVLNLGRAPFKALVLIASFTSLPNLLDSYSFKGLTPPLFSPLLPYPRIQDWLRSKIEDKWDANARLVELAKDPDVELDLVMLHARNDWEIPWEEGRMNWDGALFAATGGSVKFKRSFVREEWTSKDGKKHLVWQRIQYGGHNRIQTSEHLRLAVLRLIWSD